MKIGRDHGLRDEMSFADPRSLLVGEDDGDGVVGSGLEGLHKGVDVGRGLVRGWAIVVYNLEGTRLAESWGLDGGVQPYEDVHLELIPRCWSKAGLWTAESTMMMALCPTVI